MKTFAPFVAVLTVAALVGGCGGGSGLKFSDLFDESAAAEGTGIQGFGLVRAVVILATHEATARQRRVAEQNGRRAVAQLKARLAAEEKETPAPGPRPRPKKKKTVASTTKPKPSAAPGKPSPKTAAAKPAPAVVPEPELEEEPAPAPKPKPSKKLPRIIAVATEKNENTDKKAAKAIMLFDTQSQEIIGNKVYDIEREPRRGDEVRFETYSTSYIGASL